MVKCAEISQDVLPVLARNDVLADVGAIGAAHDTHIILLVEIVVVCVGRATTGLKQQPNSQRVGVNLYCKYTNIEFSNHHINIELNG